MRTARNFKKVKEILAKPAQKQVKVISKSTIDLVLSMYENDEFSRQTPGKKVYVSVAKEVNKQKRKPKRNVCCFQGKNMLMLILDFPNFAQFEQNGV